MSQADTGYHGQNGLLSVSDVPYRSPIAKAFVDAGSQMGHPVIDVNGEKQIGINYIQVLFKSRLFCLSSKLLSGLTRKESDNHIFSMRFSPTLNLVNL